MKAITVEVVMKVIHADCSGCEWQQDVTPATRATSGVHATESGHVVHETEIVTRAITPVPCETEPTGVSNGERDTS
jgi:hypothetical protein